MSVYSTSDRIVARDRLRGCYVTIPTLFRDDPEITIDHDAIGEHVRFVIDGGIAEGTGVLLSGGAAGDFSTMTFDERVAVAGTVVRSAGGRVPVAVGGQTTSTAELVRIAVAAAELGAEYVQVSPPFYFAHTEDDFFEHVAAIADVPIGIIVYNTYWTSLAVSGDLIMRMRDLPNVVGLKWSMPDLGFMEFEQVLSRFASDFSIIDNQMRFVTSYLLGARGIEVHVCNYWPAWGVRILDLLEAGDFRAAQAELVRVAMPFMELWSEMERYTSGDGYLDKLCMELVGLGSSRCRPPTRDVRAEFRGRARSMLIEAGVPNVLPARGA